MWNPNKLFDLPSLVFSSSNTHTRLPSAQRYMHLFAPHYVIVHRVLASSQSADVLFQPRTLIGQRHKASPWQHQSQRVLFKMVDPAAVGYEFDFYVLTESPFRIFFVCLKVLCILVLHVCVSMKFRVRSETDFGTQCLRTMLFLMYEC